MWFERPITGNSLPDGHLCLTFDDGPAHPATLEIARYLSDQQIPATFFVVGSHAAAHPAELGELIRLGHTLGNHSYTHTRLTASTTSDQKAIEEVSGMEEVLLNAGARKPLLFRAPYGGWNRRLAWLFNNAPAIGGSQTGPVGWNIDGEDHRYWRESRNPQACSANYLKQLESRRKRSGIVLFHDASAAAPQQPRPSRTPELIQMLVPKLRSQGYRFVDVWEPVNMVSAIGIEPIT